jgi:hypothetical protein
MNIVSRGHIKMDKKRESNPEVGDYCYLYNSNNRVMLEGKVLELRGSDYHLEVRLKSKRYEKDFFSFLAEFGDYIVPKEIHKSKVGTLLWN